MNDIHCDGEAPTFTFFKLLVARMRYFRAHVKNRYSFEGKIINLYITVDVLSLFQIVLCFFLTQRYNSYKKMYRLGMGPTFRNNLNY
jgi:hypothetical protein